jgi:hypothetical protein
LEDRRSWPLWRAIVALLLGAASLAAFVWLPSVLPRPRTPVATTLAQDGQHLGTWLLQLRTWGATSTVWFEKGRVWPPKGVGQPGMALNPASLNASNAAFACWSLATGARALPGTVKDPTLEFPQDLRVLERAPGPAYWGGSIEERGWPMRACWCQVAAPVTPAPGGTYVIAGGMEVADLWPSRAPAGPGPAHLAAVRVLPLRPIWLGLSVDLALFAGAWFLILSAPGAWVRWRRPGKGRCARCGYDLAGNATGACPECGLVRAAA